METQATPTNANIIKGSCFAGHKKEQDVEERNTLLWLDQHPARPILIIRRTGRRASPTPDRPASAADTTPKVLHLFEVVLGKNNKRRTTKKRKELADNLKIYMPVLVCKGERKDHRDCLQTIHRLQFLRNCVIFKITIFGQETCPLARRVQSCIYPSPLSTSKCRN